MKAVVDSFESGLARLEEIGTRKAVIVDRADLPRDAGEGSVVDDSSGTWQLDNAEAARRRSAASDLLKSLFG